MAYATPAWEVMRVRDAWKITQGNTSCLIGIVDQGFDFFQPDLKGVLISGYFANPVYHPEIYEDVANGTMVASLIHALAPNCRILTASTGVIEHPLLQMKKWVFRNHPNASLKDFQKELIQQATELRQRIDR